MAALLLIAMGVVLAAVLYILVLGLTHGPSTTPLGTNFSWGQAHNATGTTSDGCGASGASTNSFCYTIEIAVASVTTSNFELGLRNTLGEITSLPAGVTESIDLLSPTATASGCTAPGTPAIGCIAYASNGFGSSWTNNASYGGTVTGGFIVVIYTTGTATADGGMQGLELAAIGENGYSGSVISNPFP